MQRRNLQIQLEEAPTLGKSHTNDHSWRGWPCRPVDPRALSCLVPPVRALQETLSESGRKASEFCEVSVQSDP